MFIVVRVKKTCFTLSFLLFWQRRETNDENLIFVQFFYRSKFLYMSREVPLVKIK